MMTRNGAMIDSSLKMCLSWLLDFLAKLCNALAVSGLPQPISICSIFTNLRKVKVTNDEYPQDKKDLLLTAQQLGFVGSLTFLNQDAFHIFLHILPGSFINIWQACNLHGGSILAEQGFPERPGFHGRVRFKKKSTGCHQLSTRTIENFNKNQVYLNFIPHITFSSLPFLHQVYYFTNLQVAEFFLPILTDREATVLNYLLGGLPPNGSTMVSQQLKMRFL